MIRCFTTMIRCLLDEIKYNLTYRRYLPPNPLQDYIYLVEFPKSGVTYLSFIIANIELRLKGIDEIVTFYNIHRYVPDVHSLQNRIEVNQVLNRTFIKSHAEYNPYYLYVVYLLRNPFDVMVSYYNFMRGFGYMDSFEKFIHDKRFGIKRYKSHVKSWLYKGNSSQRIHLIKYEELIKEPHKQVIDLYKNLGVELSESIINEAIEKSSIKNMKYSEEFYRKFNPNYTLFFVGKDGKLAKERLLTNNVISYIAEETRDILDRFYPELNYTLNK